MRPSALLTQLRPGEQIRAGDRVLTGAIGKRVHEDFRLKTPTATIGIRGTDFETIEALCGAAGCPPGQHPGLTVTVYKGRVAVSNDAGTIEVPEGATLRVRTRSEPATFGDVAPAAPKAAPPAGRGKGAGGGESGDGGGGLRNDRGSGGASGGTSGGGGGAKGKGGPPAYEGHLLLQHVPVRY